jgi:thiamine-monophosphate kinase
VRRQCALSGGDDYELLFTAAPSAELAVRRAASTAGVEVTPVGLIVAAPGLSVHDGEGHPVDLAAHVGFDHFSHP